MFDLAKAVFSQKQTSLANKLNTSKEAQARLSKRNSILREKIFSLRKIEDERDNLLQKEKKYLSREQNLKDEFEKWKQVFSELVEHVDVIQDESQESKQSLKENYEREIRQLKHIQQKDWEEWSYKFKSVEDKLLGSLNVTDEDNKLDNCGVKAGGNQTQNNQSHRYRKNSKSSSQSKYTDKIKFLRNFRYSNDTYPKLVTDGSSDLDRQRSEYKGSYGSSFGLRSGDRNRQHMGSSDVVRSASNGSNNQKLGHGGFISERVNGDRLNCPNLENLNAKNSDFSSIMGSDDKSAQDLITKENQIQRYRKLGSKVTGNLQKSYYVGDGRGDQRKKWDYLSESTGENVILDDQLVDKAVKLNNNELKIEYHPVEESNQDQDQSQQCQQSQEEDSQFEKLKEHYKQKENDLLLNQSKILEQINEQKNSVSGNIRNQKQLLTKSSLELFNGLSMSKVQSYNLSEQKSYRSNFIQNMKTDRTIIQPSEVVRKNHLKDFLNNRATDTSSYNRLGNQAQYNQNRITDSNQNFGFKKQEYACGIGANTYTKKGKFLFVQNEIR